ncbi:DUF29 domain-containing protein [Candidatus Synechococcus calcipolaris G9]|uniref:DUF29 domain-containing protein n=1 Tax=Candidatus Synechococcus calcipolaris G9 TaxID=1497997 RepID=A0ABT6F1G3_9SYNE|nr:DUF29 domain-containing protein [Candidatus Synechococcus calcipolaris]MDG2991692.1 DUF29 domain-containing protein [Candidatus Synechococcus calcipolaris G9]
MQTQAESIALYDTDFYGWIQEQGALLRSGKFDQLDLQHLIEEIDSLGRQEQRELRNRLGILLGHLLKWHYQPKGRSKSWRATIGEQRRRILEHLSENPSLKPYLATAIAKAYGDGLDLVDRETPLNPQELPRTCPFSQAQIFEESIEWP